MWTSFNSSNEVRVRTPAKNTAEQNKYKRGLKPTSMDMLMPKLKSLVERMTFKTSSVNKDMIQYAKPKKETENPAKMDVLLMSPTPSWAFWIPKDFKTPMLYRSEEMEE